MDWFKWTTNTCVAAAYLCALIVIVNKRVLKSHHVQKRSDVLQPSSHEWISPMELANDMQETNDPSPEEEDIRALLSLDKPLNATPMIPHIIHQMWDNHTVPEVFHNHMRKWVQMHPDWQYWFWTLDDVRSLIREHYPDSLLLYDEYPSSIHKADAARLFVIHHYGGVYVDLDTEPLQPIDNWTYNYRCLVTQETEAHPFIIREERVPSVINTVLACRARHPFYRLLLSHLQSYYDRYQRDFLRAAGAMFYDDVFKRYNNGSAVVQGLHRGSELTVVPPRYFLPTYDPGQRGTLEKKCHPFHVGKLPERGQQVCTQLHRRFFSNPVPEDAFINHQWVHTYMQNDKVKNFGSQHVMSIIPHATVNSFNSSQKTDL